jgi:hypothetical protein
MLSVSDPLRSLVIELKSMKYCKSVSMNMAPGT